jgi:hypothetical protein
VLTVRWQLLPVGMLNVAELLDWLLAVVVNLLIERQKK